ncbi:DUF2911 domain-containing protein [Roseivirga sp.]|uniref:DUF2911 domain-containing protein n=1 Tax=Roseivirga sp. TaxID=1964215 RepID=UPI003B51B2B4
MKKLLLTTCLFSLAILGCNTTEKTGDNTFFFVTRLGNDTLAIERVNYNDQSLTADVVLRSPRISLTRYKLILDQYNGVTSMKATRFENGFDEDGKIIQSIESEGDSLIIMAEGRNGTIRNAIKNGNGYLPFIDMVHWPYNIAFQSAHQSADDSTHQYLLTGRRASDFIIHRTGNNEYTLRHPSRGVMYVQTNNEGELTWLDAKATTRKLIVERVNELKFDELTGRYLSIDEQGAPFGTLSPAEEGLSSFGGTEFKVTYGSPQKRGRHIFGGIVPYGELWRTGANAASHFSTTKDISVAGNTVPAGEYTLFTIPEEQGGTLIINKQTGQNGQAYNEEMDLVRVPMMREENTDEVEGFTIQVVETEQGGRIELLWDRTIYFVNFNIAR